MRHRDLIGQIKDGLLPVGWCGRRARAEHDPLWQVEECVKIAEQTGQLAVAAHREVELAGELGVLDGAGVNVEVEDGGGCGGNDAVCRGNLDVCLLEDRFGHAAHLEAVHVIPEADQAEIKTFRSLKGQIKSKLKKFTIGPLGCMQLTRIDRTSSGDMVVMQK